MIRPFRTPLVLAAMIALAGCGVFKQAKPKTPVLGQRVPILVSEGLAEVDPALSGVQVLLPPETTNTEWTQSGGNAAKSMGQLTLAATPTRAWTAHIEGSSNRARLAAAPVVANGRVYAVDVMARIHAFDAKDGHEIWSVQIGEPGRNAHALFGGGVSVEGDKLYATNGLGDIAALSAADGKQLWIKRPGGPLRGAPTLWSGNVYAVSQDNQIFALRQSDGNVEWTQAATLEVSGVFGVAAPAAAQGTVVAGFSSGELNAYRYENGRPVWQDALSRTTISTSVATLSDIDADPVIDQGRVYAIGQGGRMVALELVTGQRLWEINAAGISTPWIAGEWLFVVTDSGRMLCVARSTGKVRWSAQLPHWHNEKKKTGLISWTGPVLASGRLIAVGSTGELAYVSAADGKIQATVEAGKHFSLPPVVANNTLYLLDDEGNLSAWR